MPGTVLNGGTILKSRSDILSLPHRAKSLSGRYSSDKSIEHTCHYIPQQLASNKGDQNETERKDFSEEPL